MINPKETRKYGYEDIVINTDDLNNQNKINSSYYIDKNGTFMNKEEVETSAFISSGKHIDLTSRDLEISKNNNLLNKGFIQGGNDTQNHSQTLTSSLNTEGYVNALEIRNFNNKETIENNNSK
jgi:hypothetical protein